MKLYIPGNSLSRIGRVFFAVLALCAISGCAAFSRSTPPDYFQIDYTPQPLTCPKPFSGAVRVWNFTASAPYDREQMVVVSPSRNVRFSSRHGWIGPPGNMLADKLMRDLSLSHVFEDAVPVGSPVFAAYEMSGHVHQFALEENGAPPHAILDLEITVWQEKPVRTVLLKRHFHYQSAPLSKTDPSDFAQAMAELVSLLSTELRNDLCSVTQDSSRPAGG